MLHRKTILRSLKSGQQLPRVGILISLLAVACLFGCGAAPKTPVRPPFGYAYTYYKAPLTTNFTGEDGEPTPTTYSKYGTSKAHYFGIPFFFGGSIRFGWGNGDLEEAARNGGLSEIYYADYETLSVLGVYTEFTSYAYGE